MKGKSVNRQEPGRRLSTWRPAGPAIHVCRYLTASALVWVRQNNPRQNTRTPGRLGTRHEHADLVPGCLIAAKRRARRRRWAVTMTLRDGYLGLSA